MPRTSINAVISRGAVPNVTDWVRYAAMLSLPVLIFIPAAFGLHVVEDDYYYYERIARHILLGAGSTFDGVVPTNGYQPLWMACELIAVGLERLTHFPAEYVALAICSVLSILVLLRLRVEPRSGALSIAIVLALTAYLAFFGATAMEVSLLLLCSACFFRQVRAMSYVITPAAGALLALCFLARIDSMVYFAPLLGYLWLRSPSRGKVLGTVPLALTIGGYALLNLRYFRIPFPISGIAKSVISITTLHAATWTSIFQGAQDRLMIVVTILLSLWAAIAGTRRDRILVGLSVMGVVLYFAVTSLRSDWPVWQWYEFPFALHLMLLGLAEAPGRPKGLNRWVVYAATAGASLAVLLVGFRNISHAKQEMTMVMAAQRLKSFFADKPTAIVAMGDRAGSVGAALPNRLVQLEGLVMDKRFLDTMGNAGSLAPVLAAYHVDYYIATNPYAEGNGCFMTWEPGQSRGDSIRVRGDVCARVVMDFSIEGWRTVVFAMRPSS